MNNRRVFLLTAGSAAMTLATFGCKSPALALAPKTTSILLPLSGVFFIPPNPVIPAGENVTLAGDTHVVTQVSFPPDPILPRKVNVHLNMAGVQGTGQTSGSLYIGTGSTKFIGLGFYPPDPVLPVAANFTLETTNGSASVPLPLKFQLFFANEGTLLSESSVSLASCNLDQPNCQGP